FSSLARGCIGPTASASAHEKTRKRAMNPTAMFIKLWRRILRLILFLAYRALKLRHRLPRRAPLVVACGVLGLASVSAQDMMRHIDLTSAEMTSAEMTRADVQASIAAATNSQPADFTGKKLSGLDLSGLDLSGAIF